MAVTITTEPQTTTITSTAMEGTTTEDVFIVTPETTIFDDATESSGKGKTRFVTLTPGIVVTTTLEDENDVETMSSQHVQKVTKAPANIPDNFLTSVVSILKGGKLQQNCMRKRFH